MIMADFAEFVLVVETETTRHRDNEFERFYLVSKNCVTLSNQASALHRYNEVNCNYGFSDRTELLYQRLVEKVKKTAAELGFEVIINRDPRGASLKLVLPSERTNDSGHTGYVVPY